MTFDNKLVNHLKIFCYYTGKWKLLAGRAATEWDFCKMSRIDTFDISPIENLVVAFCTNY